MKNAIVVLALLSWLSACEPDHADHAKVARLISQLDSSRILLPDGWELSPAGRALPLGDLPMNLVVSPHGKYIAVTNNGYGKQTIILIDPAHEQILDQKPISMSWLGLAFSLDDSHLFASGGNNNRIIEYAIRDGKLNKVDSIVLGEPWPVKISPTGIALDDASRTLFICTKEDSALYAANVQTKVIRKLKLDAEAYTCLLSPDHRTLYASVWGGREVVVVDATQLTLKTTIAVGDHPNAMTMTHDGRYLFVAESGTNAVSVIDTHDNQVIEKYNSSVVPDSPEGSTPNALALSDDENRLYIADANNNCLAVFDVSTPGNGRSIGFIPTGWYPTSVQVWGHKIWVTNGKGFKSGANPHGPNPYKHGKDLTQYTGSMFLGTMSIIDEPDENTLQAYSAAVVKNTPYSKEIEKEAEGEEGNPIPRMRGDSTPIRYVFYIIKENRTYDQVFGDITSGNGDSTLCLFPKKVTPNQHALATQFVLLDHFFVNAEVSADGHNWSMAAYANDYVEKTWPSNYSDRGGNYDYEGSRKIAYPAAGFLWDDCARNNVSYRSYGEFVDVGTASMPSLEHHFDTHFPSFDLTIPDMHRYNVWKKDFDSLVAAHALPRLSIIRLPDDHTAGMEAGMPSPRAFVAENDQAVGALIQHLSQSSVWKQSVVFVLEDDAQSGPDHVDAHRSNILVIGPYVKRHQTISRMYTTTAVLRTIELILGLPPMSQYDAGATPLWYCFQKEPDFTPYTALPPTYNLAETNPSKTSLSEQAAHFNLRVEDAVPDLAFSENIWGGIRGIDSPMPAPVRSAFIIPVARGDKDDD